VIFGAASNTPALAERYFAREATSPSKIGFYPSWKFQIFPDKNVK
jgi:hypothetical protein